LTVCNLIRKIYSSFDFDGDRNLDKIEVHALLDTLLREIATSDTSINVKILKDRFRNLELEGNISEKILINAICGFFGVQLPDKRTKNEDIPSPLVRKSASVGRLISRNLSNLSNRQQEKVD